MRKWWRHLLILAVIGYSGFVLIPTVQYYRLSAEERERLPDDKKNKFVESAIKLGLDLQGGMHLVLEVDDAELDENQRKDALDRAIKIIRNRVDQFGVSEPVIQKQGGKRIIVQLPGLQDPERAKSLIGQTALLEFRLVRERDEVVRVLQELDRALKDVRIQGAVVDTAATAGTAAEPKKEKPKPREGKEAQTASAGKEEQQTPFPIDSIIPTLPGEKELEVPLQPISAENPFTSYIRSISAGAILVDERKVSSVNLLLDTPQAKRVIPKKSEFLWESEAKPVEGGGTGRLLYLVETSPVLTGRTLVDATTRPDPDDPSTMNVAFNLNREGGLVFARFTGENIGRRLAIVLDRKIRSAPVIQTRIPGGEGRITGRFTDEEANDLAIVLRAGALPAPVEIREERSVGPTLGRDSITQSVRAAGLGFVFVLLFMVVYYRLSGILACAAVLLNLVIVIAVLARLHAALTLPGIAGLILTIGMSVDANVLIFERIREEIAKAKTIRSAIDSGYDRAFTTILDANVTTLITAFVLWQFGTGPIKGFATTLSIGIVASMFTALLCTRVVYDTITSRWTLKKLSV